MYKLYIFKTDGHTAKYDYKTKPTFDDMYSMIGCCLLYTSPSPRDKRQSRMQSSA